MAIEKEMIIRSILSIALCFCLTGSFSQTVNDLRPTVTMKEYVDMQAQLNKEWSEKFMSVQYENIKENVRIANAAMEKRLDGINEFRGQLKDQAGTFVTRNELWTAAFAISGLVFAALSYMKRNQVTKT